MDIVELFRQSFSMLAREPKLFIPKIVVAFLYGFGMLATAFISLESLPIILSPESFAPEQAFNLLSLSLMLFVYSIFLFAIDVLVNSMYPVLVKDFKQRNPISLPKALRFALSKFWIVFPAVIVVDFAVAIPFALLLSLVALSGNIVAFFVVAALFLAASFLVIVLFYVVYPVSVLSEKNFVSALLKATSLGAGNLKHLSMPSLIPFTLSVINFALAFLAANPAFLVAFIVLRFLIALVYTYHMVLNPNVYFELVRK